MPEAIIFLQSTDLIFRVFEDEDLAVVYDPRNGNTHLFSIVAHELYQLLASAPATLQELKFSLFQRFSDDDQDMITAAVDAAFVQLQCADLIDIVAN
ncbi:hypothetical protein AT959_06765 [Dechloromonas denitrificans]|uniref:HPr-rel-A system PqqD family protein n=1 Tax=Dechloromonas denitrificans TaxID=281362 RepID=A0A133XKA5_9RHOO|nr:HPr-rel-A system PqqD family peptide chaperone [Dechloromonas denitrificans]KXB31369.1 hypothetical protein AT959_06765 [Dechloromonas denitrificans]